MNNLQEDIKTLQAEKRKLNEKMRLMEKNSKSRIDELLRLQGLNEKLKRQIDMNEIDAKDEAVKKFSEVQLENQYLNRKVVDQEKTLRHIAKERVMEVREWKHRFRACQLELQELREIHDQTLKRLEVRIPFICLSLLRLLPS